jgi:hypothetical protein
MNRKLVDQEHRATAEAVRHHTQCCRAQHAAGRPCQKLGAWWPPEATQKSQFSAAFRRAKTSNNSQ